jgi:hypothetical protein
VPLLRCHSDAVRGMLSRLNRQPLRGRGRPQDRKPHALVHVASERAPDRSDCHGPERYPDRSCTSVAAELPH